MNKAWQASNHSDLADPLKATEATPIRPIREGSQPASLWARNRYVNSPQTAADSSKISTSSLTTWFLIHPKPRFARDCQFSNMNDPPQASNHSDLADPLKAAETTLIRPIREGDQLASHRARNRYVNSPQTFPDFTPTKLSEVRDVRQLVSQPVGSYPPPYNIPKNGDENIRQLRILAKNGHFVIFGIFQKT